MTTTATTAATAFICLHVANVRVGDVAAAVPVVAAAAAAVAAAAVRDASLMPPALLAPVQSVRHVYKDRRT
jgi:hypothetical protein